MKKVLFNSLKGLSVPLALLILLIITLTVAQVPYGFYGTGSMVAVIILTPIFISSLIGGIVFGKFLEAKIAPYLGGGIFMILAALALFVINY